MPEVGDRYAVVVEITSMISEAQSITMTARKALSGEDAALRMT